jgi:hypothetical protein
MRRITGIAMATLVALTLAACGGDDDASSDDTTTTTTTTEGSDDGATDDGGDDGSTDGLAAGLIDEDCQFLLAGAFLNPLVDAQSGAGGDLEESSARLEAIADEAPEEIQDAMAALTEGYAEFAEMLKDVDLSDAQSLADPDVQEAFQELGSVFDEEYQEAGETVSTYVAENCTG